MDRARVHELHYIAHIESLDSICTLGLLSHNRAAHVDHVSVADEDVQDRRRDKRVPQGRLLHDYVNLYFDARNPMMSRIRAHNPHLVVVRVDPIVMDLPGTVITDGNAASSGTRFFVSPDGLAELDERPIFARYWTDHDPIEYWEKKRQRCAEVLVPDTVRPEYILGCYAYDAERMTICQEVANHLAIEVQRDAFF